MEDILNIIKAKYYTGDLSQCIEGIKLSSNVIDEIVDSSLALFKNEKVDKLLLSENISVFFDYYFIELQKLLNSNDNELRFWAASLIIHHNILNEEAEQLLIKTIIHGEIEKAQIATTILTRNKRFMVNDAIKERIKSDKGMNQASISFFIEKLEQLDRQSPNSPSM